MADVPADRGPGVEAPFPGLALSGGRRSALWLWAPPVLWTLLVGLALWWNMAHVRSTILNLAHVVANASVQKDFLLHHWAARWEDVEPKSSGPRTPLPDLGDGSQTEAVVDLGPGSPALDQASLTRQLRELGGRFHLPSSRIVRRDPTRPEDEPDAWEQDALGILAGGASEVSTVETGEGGTTLRLMRPLRVQATCLECHGDQGYRVGDLRGGLSVAVPLEDFSVSVSSHQRAELAAHGLLWALGLLAYGVGAVQIQRRRQERDRAQQTLTSLATSFAHLSGRPFFETATRHIATTLGVAHVFVGRYQPHRNSVRILGGYTRGRAMVLKTYALTGTPCENVVGKEICFHPAGVQALFPKDQALAKMDGESYLGAPIFDTEHRPLGLLVALHSAPMADPKPILDVFRLFLDRISAEMQRSQALADLEKHRELLATTEQLAQIGGWEWDIASATMTWTEETYRIHGFEPDTEGGHGPDLIERSLECYRAEDRSMLRAAFDACVERGQRYDLELPFRTAQGRSLTVRTAGRPVLEDGRVVKVVGHIMDITEQRRAEQEYQMLFREMQDGFALHEILCDATGQPVNYRYLAVNPAFERLTGLRAGEITGKTVLEVLPSVEHRWIETYGRVALTGQPAFFEEWAQALGKCFRVTAFRPAPNQFACIFVDVTAEKQLQEQLRQAQKMEAIGQLAGGVAHDFNNILAAMMMNLDLMGSSPGQDPEILQSIQDLKLEARRAASLTRQLLMFSRRSVLEMRSLDLNEVVSNLLKMLGRLLGEHIRLDFEPQTPLPTVEADAGMLEQVLMNLVVNARDAMPKGGQITLATAAVDFDARQAAAHPGGRAGRFARLTVSDTGCGMDAATLDRIFEPFFTTKTADRGTGLGLATSYGIVAQHRGWIEVDSTVGVGSTFRVYFPAATTEPRGGAEARSDAAPTGKETLLVVEDDASVRRMVVQTLRALGYRVLEATNGHEALQVWRDHASQVDLLLTDVVMPEGMTGLELVEKLRAERPELKVIVSSGYSGETTFIGRLTDTGIVYLPKPYPAPLLARTVRTCLDRTSASA